MHGLSGDEFLFQQDGAAAPRARHTTRFNLSERRKNVTRGTFRARILTVFSRSVMTTNNSDE